MRSDKDPHNQILDENRPLVGEEAFAYDRSKAEVSEWSWMQPMMDLMHLYWVLQPSWAQWILNLHWWARHFYSFIITRSRLLFQEDTTGFDVRDIVEAAITSIEKGVKGQKYLLAGHWHSFTGSSKAHWKAYKAKDCRDVMPFWLAWIGLPFITIYSKISGRTPLYTRESLKIIINCSKQISYEKAKRELGFNPRSMDETVKDSMKWFDLNGYL